MPSFRSPDSTYDHSLLELCSSILKGFEEEEGWTWAAAEWCRGSPRPFGQISSKNIEGGFV